MARKRPAWRRIKIHRSYTVDETSRVLGIAKGTVRRWLKSGLPSLADQRPTLILGSDLVEFGKRQSKAKQKCRLDECFCFSCRTPKRPAFGEAEYIPMTPTNGNLRALCETCATVMHKRISNANLKALRGILDVTIMQAEERISDSGKPCLNDYLKKEPKPHA
ncbi:helix-turn-helix domain-containing protein [Stappia sp. F7233]|uniref:Helix-turn-helix domain-containing protein n=1 Tax=Stappia albiluteola TaxID=2758565 RepID=A0A839ADY5_9HYPH|nr:helix-turn-helix domain-containing protein [Stappia albiluteola]MBA5777027.1 helix-turn-helix domain-containing protein [Stappia albiluteola]